MLSNEGLRKMHIICLCVCGGGGGGVWVGGTGEGGGDVVLSGMAQTKRQRRKHPSRCWITRRRWITRRSRITRRCWITRVSETLIPAC